MKASNRTQRKRPNWTNEFCVLPFVAHFWPLHKKPACLELKLSGNHPAASGKRNAWESQRKWSAFWPNGNYTSTFLLSGAEEPHEGGG